jgi:hypothetical protein
MTNDDLTPKEREAFKKLAREKTPSEGLEDRTVAALHDAGLLRPARGRSFTLNGPRVAALMAACFALVATGFGLGRWSVSPVASPTPRSVTLSSDLAKEEEAALPSEPARKSARQDLAERRGADVEQDRVATEAAGERDEAGRGYEVSVNVDDAEAGPSLAVQFQEKSSAYLEALARFEQMPTERRMNDPAREVALNSLSAVADETLRLFPDEDTAGRLRAVLDTGKDARARAEEVRESKVAAQAENIIWF